MSEKPRELSQIQRWVQAVITHPDGIESGVASDDARREIDVDPSDIESIITPSRALSSTERLAVYGNAYYARLLECMREFFPAIVYALDEEVFDAFTVGYLQEYPSHSYTLNHLADHFVEYLEETRPELDEDDPNDERIGWPEFLIDLARMEQAIDEVFDGPGVEGRPLLTAEQLEAIEPERWPTVRLEPVPCLRLLALRFPVNDYYTAFRHDEQPDIPDPADTYLALTRRDYVVQRFDLSEPQYELLCALMSGKRVGAAITEAADAADDVEAFSASLQNWFHLWTAEGFFENVELGD